MTVVAVACGGSSITVPTGPHRPQVEVPPEPVSVPPPPAKVEIVPLRRNEQCLYLDGHYAPLGAAWNWEKGRWILPPEDCYYAPPTTQYEKVDGGTTLVFRKGVWLAWGDSLKKCADALPCPASDPNLVEK